MQRSYKKLAKDDAEPVKDADLRENLRTYPLKNMIK